MKRFTISIPDNKVDFFLELMKNIQFVKNIQEDSSIDVPEEHKAVVRERIAKYKNNPDDYLNLDQLENKLDTEQ